MSAFDDSYEIGRKSQKDGFDWPSAKDVLHKVKEELKELEEARGREHQEEELGDLLFSVTQLARHLDFNPETALHKANEKFLSRYDQMMVVCQRRGQIFSQLSLEEKEQLWQTVKKS